MSGNPRPPSEVLAEILKVQTDIVRFYEAQKERLTKLYVEMEQSIVLLQFEASVLLDKDARAILQRKAGAR